MFRIKSKEVTLARRVYLNREANLKSITILLFFLKLLIFNSLPFSFFLLSLQFLFSSQLGEGETLKLGLPMPGFNTMLWIHYMNIEQPQANIEIYHIITMKPG